MKTTLKILTWAGKALGVASVLDWTGISPKYGVVIFFVASLLKDTVNRVGDFLDDGQSNNSFKP